MEILWAESLIHLWKLSSFDILLSTDFFTPNWCFLKTKSCLCDLVSLLEPQKHFTQYLQTLNFPQKHGSLICRDKIMIRWRFCGQNHWFTYEIKLFWYSPLYWFFGSELMLSRDQIMVLWFGVLIRATKAFYPMSTNTQLSTKTWFHEFCQWKQNSDQLGYGERIRVGLALNNQIEPHWHKSVSSISLSLRCATRHSVVLSFCC